MYKKDLFKQVLTLFTGGIEHLSKIDTVKPDVIFCCLSSEVVDKCWSIVNEKVKREDKKKIKALAKSDHVLRRLSRQMERASRFVA